jgi:hypothetical protein
MPGQFEGILDKLQTKLGKQTIKRASTINRPRPKREVQQIQIFNEFNRRNPKADGGSVNGSYEAAFRAKVEELMDDGYDFGEAVREAMRQGYKNGGEAKYKYQTRKAPTGFFYDRRGKLKRKKPPKGYMYTRAGGLVKKLDTKTIKEIKKRFPNKKFDFKTDKFGVTKNDPDFDKIRFMDPERKKLEKQNKAKPESRARAKARAKEYYATEKENILQRAKDRYRSDDLVGKTGKTAKQLSKEKNIDRIIRIQNTIGVFPNGYMKSGNKRFYKPELAVWHDLYDSTTKKGQDRWVLPKKYKNNVPINELGKKSWGTNGYYKKIKFVDKKTGEIIKLDETIKGKGKTLKEYLDTTITKETGQKRVFQKAKDGYELKNKVKDYEIDYKGNKERLGTLFAKASAAKSGDTVLSAFEVHHPYGKKNRWWDNQVALREANRELNYIDSRLQRAYKNAPTQAQKNKIFKQFGKEVDKLPGGITYFFEGQQVGSRMPTVKSILDEGAKFYKMAKPVVKKVAKAVPLVGTAIGIADVANAYEQGVRNPIDLFAAYQISPEAAVSAKRYREDPEYRQEQIRNLPNIEGEASLDNFTSYFNGGIVSLKGVK